MELVPNPAGHVVRTRESLECRKYRIHPKVHALRLR